MPSLAEFLLAIRGCARLLRFDIGAFGYFDRSAAGARRSFGVAVPVYLYYLLQILDAGAIPDGAEFSRYLVAMSIGYVFLWVSFPLVLLGMAEYFEWRDRVPGVISVYNWSTLLTVALHLPTIALGYAGWSGPLAAILDYAALLFTLILNGFIFRRLLEIPLTPSALLVIGDFALAQLVILPISAFFAMPS